MKEKEIRRSLQVFPIGVVMELTGLSARQIRYYELNRLITPSRTNSKRRLYSMEDVDRLLEIQEHLSNGINIAGVKAILGELKPSATPEESQAYFQENGLTSEEMHQIVRNEIMELDRYQRLQLRQGDLHRFLKH